MPDYTASKTLFQTEDRKEIVGEDDERAAFLVIREGGSLPEAEARRLGVLGQLEEAKPEDAVAREKAAIEAARERGAFEEAAIRERNLPRIEAEAEAGTAVTPALSRAAAPVAVGAVTRGRR